MISIHPNGEFAVPSSLHLQQGKKKESTDTEVLMQLKGRADMTSVTRLQECKPVKVGTFPSPSLYSQQVHRLAGCDTCKGSWSCACLLAAVKEGARAYVTAERQAGVYQWG